MTYFTDCPQEGVAQCDDAVPVFDRLHQAQREDRYEDVLRLAEEVQQICPQCPHGATDKANALRNTGEHEAAMKIVDELLAGGLDGHPQVVDEKGILLALAGDREAAIPWLEKSWAAAPEAHPANCHLAQTLYSLRRSKDALPYARRAWATEPTEDVAAALVIGSLLDLDMREDLSEALCRISEVDWRYSVLVVTVATAFDRLGETDDAARWCRKALELDPEDEEALCMLGEILYSKKKEYDSAFDVFSRLHHVAAGHARSGMLFTAREVADEIGDLGRAIDLVVQACIWFPDDDDLRQYHQHLVDRLAGNVEELAKEQAMWRKRFDALSDDHSSLRTALREMQQAAQPGSPLAIALVEGEGQSIEFMKTYPQNAHDLAKEIAAFSTSNDGTIFLGVTDDGEVVGMPSLDDVGERDALQQRISGVTTGIVGPSVNVSVSFVPYKGKTVVRVFVPKGARPLYWMRNVPYLRDIDQSRPAKPDEVEALILQGRKPVTGP